MATNVELKIIKKEEFEDLMNLMNFSFGFEKEEDKFEHILPKYYYKDNDNMVHLGLYDKDVLISSIGIYPLEFIRKDRTLKAAMIGAVSTHPDHRGKGYFSLLMEAVMKYCNDKYDILCLTGKRERYNRYDFEYSGLSVNFKIDKNGEKHCKSPLFIKGLHENDHELINQCLALYNSSFQRVYRTKEDFYKVVLSWNNVPYVILKENKVVAYFSLKENSLLSEFKYDVSHLEEIISLLRATYGDLAILGNYDDINKGLDKFVDGFEYTFNVMYRINNYPKVIEFLEFSEFDKDIFDSLNSLDKVRYVMGKHEEQERDLNTKIFVHNCDQG